MDNYSFFCFGHSNILGTHSKTLEFTKDEHLTLDGDCIIGIKANFEFFKLKKFISDKNKIKITIICDNIQDELDCLINSDFNDSHEIVIRKSEFNSKRTLGIRSSKGSSDLNRLLIDKMKKPEVLIKVILTPLK
jgi:uncharacterized protein